MAIDIVEQADYDVLVEVTPTDAKTGEPAMEFMKKAITMGKYVVTSNKGPIALHHAKLQSLARKHHVAIRYEATVGGAIPIMHTLEYGLAGNRVIAIFGILNGTANYILTRMTEEGKGFQEVSASESGYRRIKEHKLWKKLLL
jgi:homoserine dehydrogenase